MNTVNRSVKMRPPKLHGPLLGLAILALPGSLPAQNAPPAAPAPSAASMAAAPQQPSQPAPSAPAMTLADVVRMALGNNTGILAARLRCRRANELVAQVDSENNPQWRLDAGDLYSSYDTAAPSLPTVWIVNPALPSGGIIPPVVDAAGNFSSAFLGGSSASAGGSSYGGGAISLTPGILTTNSTNSSAPAESGSSTPSNGGASTPATGAGAEAGSPAGGAPSGPAKHPNPRAAKSSSRVELGPALGLAAIPIVADAVAGGGEASDTGDDTPLSASAVGVDAARDDDDPVQNPAQDAAASPSASTTDYKRDNYAARLSVIQYLDVFGVIPNYRDAERDISDFYSLDVQRLENETALAAKDIYFNALYAKENLATQQEQVSYATENVRIAQSRYANGFAARFDVLTAQTALATAQQRLTAAQNEQNLAQADLAYLLGIPPGQQIDIIEPALPPLDTTLDVAQSTKTALAERPEILQAEKNVNEAERLVQVAGSSELPAVGLIATAENTGTESTTLPDDSAAVGAVVDFPFDDGGVTRSRVRSAKLDVQQQKLALEQLQFAVGLEVQQAAYNIQNAQAQVAQAESAVAQSQEALNIARERYSDGMGTFLDILNALSELAGTRTNYSTAQYLYEVSLAQLVRAMGGR